VAARKKKIQVPYAQTGWFPSRITSRMHFETFGFGNHPVCGFATATPPNLGGDTLTGDTFITRYKSLVLALILCLLFSFACQRRLPGTSSQGSATRSSAIRLNNLGVARMNQGRMMEALDSFRQAYRGDSSLWTARMNEGIALLNLQRFDEAEAALSEATRLQPNSARAWYNLGILNRNISRVEPAVAAFEQVSRIDSEDADAFYFLGQLHAQAMRFDQSIAAYQRALTLDSVHVSAEFGLARAYQLSGNDALARQHLARFDQLTQSKIGKTISLTYGEQGPYSTAEPVAGAAPAPAQFVVRFAATTTADSGLALQARTQNPPSDRVLSLLGPGACFIDFDSNGTPDLLLPGDARGVRLYRNGGKGTFTDVTQPSGLNVTGEGLGCAVGDYDNDGHDDIAVGTDGRILVYRNLGNGTFQDVTARLGIQVDGLPLGLLFVDYDHDGDIDLYVSIFENFQLDTGEQFRFPFTSSSPGLNVLWRNNGNGTFTNQTMQTELAGDAAGIAALSADFNNDRAVDFLVTGWRTSPAVYRNSREGAFRNVQEWKSAFPSVAAGAVTFDFDKDGWMDVAMTHWGQPGLSIWRNVSGGGFERIGAPEPEWSRGWGLAAADVDNDGWIDLAAVGERAGANAGAILLLRNMGEGRFVDASAEATLATVGLVRPRALVSGDMDGDGDSDLLVTQNGGSPVLLRNDGGNRRAALQLALDGLSDNRSAIGTKVEVFAGAMRQKWEVGSSSGYLGQNAPGILAGIDDAKEADIVRLLWPTGVPQDEVQLTAARRHVVKEVDRRGSSCPMLFVWNGERYDFVADAIGPGIIGEWLGPGERNIPDPTEYVKVDGNRVRLKNGKLSFRFAEVMEETTYLDQVRLLAIDHPSGIAVYPNEYFASQPPFPEFKVITSRDARPPRAALDDRGRNVLPQLLQRDRRYVTGFESLPFTGFAKTHFLELDLGPIDTARPLRLVMHGFTDYFTVTSIFAAHQADVHAVVPFLEVQGSDGQWKRVSDDIGFPAGLARTMIADLSGRLPAGTSRVRIGTNLKIYWDQILIDTSEPSSSVRVHEIPIVEASLSFRGYPRRVEGSVPGDASFIYEDVSRTGPFGRQAGQYTATGNVLPLLTHGDDRFAIFGSGDDVALEFDPSSLPPLPAGWSRDYFFYADGYAKDMDFYSAYSDTVEPLPFHAMGQYPYGTALRYPDSVSYLAYRLGFNTRSISTAQPSYRFKY
jgi:tetratricopeptide (TPR) repeat protein